MNIKTKSIIDSIELQLNKVIEDITDEDLDSIKYLKIYRDISNEELIIDINDLKMFKNIEEITIENCMVDKRYINNLKLLKKIRKIDFIHCDFIDNIGKYFENLLLDELVINDVIGTNDFLFSKIKKFVIVNSDINFDIKDVFTLDISRCSKIKRNLTDFDINEIIINENQLTDEFIKLPYKLIIKDDYDEVIRVIEHD